MKNLLLRLLSPADLKLLTPHLRSAHCEQQHALFAAEEKIGHVYFPTSAVVSLVVTLSTGEIIEAAMVGMDGVVGASAALDGKISLSRGIIQLGGEIVVCDIDALKSTALQSPKLLSLLVRHEQTVYAQAQQSAACFATHQVEARLCRWLLRPDGWRSRPPTAGPPIRSRQGCAAGCFAHGICREATISPSRRN